MNIAVDFGHTLSGANYGAVGILNESDETRNIGKPLIQYLEQLGHKVTNITVDKASSNSQSINQRVNKANAQSFDLIVSVHLNAFNGKAFGVEVLTYQGKQMDSANRILKNIEKLGYTNRGIKNGTSPRRLGIINSTKSPSMIVECFFCDNQGDVGRYIPNDVAKAIAEGITSQTIDSGVSDKVEVTKPSIDSKPSMQPINNIKVKLIGKDITTKGFLEDGINYMNINDSYFSIREVLENLQLDVSWEVNTVVAKFKNDYTIPKDNVSVNLLGNVIQVEAINKEDTYCLKLDGAYIPIREIFETMGLKVGYDSKSKTIMVTE